MRKEEGLLESALAHHFGQPGSRSRARLALRASACLGLSRNDGLALATAVELLHNASLVQDDLQDRSGERRGQAALWCSHGEHAALGVVDLLLGGAYRALAEVSAPPRLPPLLIRLQEAVADTLRGQMHDLGGGANGQASVEEMLATAAGKSGPLFALGIELPLLYAGYEAALPRARAAAVDFGIGYQIVDDLADREEDRAAGRANLALALERSSGANAESAAKALAQRHLRAAAAGGRALPCACGAHLGELSDRLLTQLEALGHD
ncbi:MAG: polyprenyl synthetase family protein [Opitutales bacterium]